MSIESMMMTAFTGFKANNQYKDAKSEAQVLVNNANATDAALANTGQLAAQRNSEQVEEKAATARVSFLNSGLTLEGTPAKALDQIYVNGKADTQNIILNYNTQISNNLNDVNAKSRALVNKGRASAIDTIVKSFSHSDLGGSMGSMFDTAATSAGSAMNNAGYGNAAYDMFDSMDNMGI